MKIILVRHGQTTANHQHLIQGWTDNPLNEKGKKEAHEAGKFLKTINYHADRAFSSPLTRAIETGNIMLKEFSSIKEINLDFHFIERNFGPFEQKEVKTTFQNLLVKDFTYPGYENDKILLNRVKIGLDNLYKHYKDEDIIIFCHSHVIKSFLILAEPNNYNFKTFIDNGSLHKFSYDGVKLKLLEFNLNRK